MAFVAAIMMAAFLGSVWAEQIAISQERNAAISYYKEKNPFLRDSILQESQSVVKFSPLSRIKKRVV